VEQTSHVWVAKSERPRLTNGEIIFEEFQPMWSQFTNVTDGRAETTCNRNTALCTKVHRAVKTVSDQSMYSVCGKWSEAGGNGLGGSGADCSQQAKSAAQCQLTLT